LGFTPTDYGANFAAEVLRNAIGIDCNKLLEGEKSKKNERGKEKARLLLIENSKSYQIYILEEEKI
jgi:hypothetical protein